MGKVDDSRFTMWRAVITIIHADGVVTPHELSFLNDYLKEMNLTDEQRRIVAEDLKAPQDTVKMFKEITNVQDKRDFFMLARAVSWCDGDLDRQEDLIIRKLEKHHLDEESREWLAESRDMMNEVELSNDQWDARGGNDERRGDLFSFFGRLKTRTA
jgi:uncharacterized membrane protein YebE (DUF533 family)